MGIDWHEKKREGDTYIQIKIFINGCCPYSK